MNPDKIGIILVMDFRRHSCIGLVAPYCAIPRDYLSDTPLLRAMGFLVSQHGQLGAIPPPPFLSISPLESMQSGGAIPPPQKGYLSDTGAIPYENKANGCDTPLCDTISKGYCAIWGGISHWAAKCIGVRGCQKCVRAAIQNTDWSRPCYFYIFRESRAKTQRI